MSGEPSHPETAPAVSELGAVDANNNPAQDVPVPSSTDVPAASSVGDASEGASLMPAVAAVAAAGDSSSETGGNDNAAQVAPDNKPGQPAPAQTPAAPAATPSKPAPAAAAAVHKHQPSAAPSALIDQANEELAFLLTHGKINQSEVMALQKVIRENVALKEKVAKLKSLLARSAKAQKDAKVELEGTRRRLEESNGEVRRLTARVDSLASRPTHMDLLADFETNFDKALLSIGTSEQASGQESSSSAAKPSATAGVDSASDLFGGDTGASAPDSSGANVESSLLLTELSDAKARIDKLESLNAALLARASKLEKTNESFADEREKAAAKMTNLQLELRMAKMEAEHAARSARDRESSLTEMQLEIDLVTKSAMDANVRAAVGEEAAKTVQTDKEYVKELEAKVTALQEWALAAAEAKRVAQERAARLEEKIRDLTEVDEDGGLSGGKMGSTNAGSERRLWQQHSSLVVGAGLVGTRVHVLGDAVLEPNESVVLRWKFDLTPADTDIVFSILKGRWEEVKKSSQLKSADAIIRDRTVLGGAAGEATGAFAVKNACTLVWSNEKSWVRPKTVKYTVEAFAIM